MGKIFYLSGLEQDLAEAAGVPVLELHPYQGWHRACGNGMVVGNVGMVVLATVAVLVPRPVVFDPYLNTCISQRDMLGIPDTVRYHGGWKKWRVSLGGTHHAFDDKKQAVQVAFEFLKVRNHLEFRSVKLLSEEVKEAGQKASRKKEELIEAVVRIRYKKNPPLCSCCTLEKKARAVRQLRLVLGLLVPQTSGIFSFK